MAVKLAPVDPVEGPDNEEHDEESSVVSLDDVAAPQTETGSARDAVLNLDDIRLDQDFDPNEVEEDKSFLVLKKPPKDDYFRIHPDPAMTMNVGIYEPSDGDEPYLVTNKMVPLFGDLVSRRQVFVGMTGRGVRFLWPAKLPSGDGGGRRGGGGDKYNRTALKAADKAKTRWVRMFTDQTLKQHRWVYPTEPPPEPDWWERRR
jgi:hypothetical protein